MDEILRLAATRRRSGLGNRKEHQDLASSWPASSRRDQGLALFDDVSDGESRRLVAVLTTVRHSRGNLESIPSIKGPRALAVNAQFQRAIDDIARFNPGMGMARDQRPRIEVNADVDGLVAVHRPISAGDDRALQCAGRNLNFGRGR